MPNTIRRPLVHPAFINQPAPLPVSQTGGSSMMRAASIVELYETGRYDVANFRGRDVTALPARAATTNGGLVGKVQQWLGLIATELSEGRAALSRTAEHSEVTDPLHDSRQAFSTFRMDAQRLSGGATLVPDWKTVTTALHGMVNDFKGGVCEDPDPKDCEKGLTAYFEGAEEFDRAAEDFLWRVGNLRTFAGSFPPYLAALAEDWFQTIDLLRLPLAACVFYWGVEQSTACSLEIAKYYDKEPRVAGYARQQFQRLEQFRTRAELVASVERTRELVIATGRYWSDTRELVLALGPFAGRAWELVESARDALGQAKDTAWRKVKKETVVSEEAKSGTVPTAAPPAKPAGTSPPPPGGAGLPERPPERPPLEHKPPVPAPDPAYSGSPVMRATPVTSGGRRQPAVSADALIREAERLAEAATPAKQETAPRTPERQPPGTRRRARR